MKTNIPTLKQAQGIVKQATRAHWIAPKALPSQKVVDDMQEAAIDNLESKRQRVEQMQTLGYSVHDIMPLIF